MRTSILRGDKDCFRLIDDDVVIQIPALPRPTLAELKAQYPRLVERIIRDDSPTEAVTLRFATVLKSKEDSVTGEVCERRLAPRRKMLLGIQQRDWLIVHQDELSQPARSALKLRFNHVGICSPGLVVVRWNGDKMFPCMREYDDARWHGYWDWFGNFNRLVCFAVSSKPQ